MSLKKSDIVLCIGLIVLIVGAILSMMSIQPVADYVLVAGAVTVIFRGALRARERDDNNGDSNQV